MFMLTLGPTLNFSAFCIFRAATHPSWLYNRAWLSSETLEFIGITVLDISLIDMEEHQVLFAELLGFIILCYAAILQFEYSLVDVFPVVTFRLDMIHSSECFGLIMLIIVAYGQFRLKLHKHEQEAYQYHHRQCDTV
jgi:hypothetical protein